MKGIPVVKKLYIKTMLDLVEATHGEHNILHLARNGKHYYYLYSLYTTEWIVILMLKTDKKFKRYLYVMNGVTHEFREVVESDKPPTQPCIAIIDVEKDPFLLNQKL